MSDDQQPDASRPPGHHDRSDAPTMSGNLDPASMSLGYGPAAPALAAGQTYGAYRIVRLLGRGGMGEVYEASDLTSGRRVALKVLARVHASDHARHRFEKEGRLAASLSHPSCVYVFHAGEIGTNPVIAMELLPDGTLKDRVDAEGPLPYREAVDAILSVVDGLEAAHGTGILHRDVKPSNCFIDADGTTKIGDFGLSMSTMPTEETQLTRTGMMLGTPAYASPEQLQGDTLDARSDIYSVGATLYYLLTGQLPLDAESAVRLVAAILQQTPDSPARHRPELPKGLCQAVLRCLAKKPTDRLTDYAALRAALLPYSSLAASPARWRPRILAGVFDWMVWWLVSVLAVTAGVPMTLGPILALLALKILYWSTLEGIWGSSVGKRQFGIRVVDASGAVPGIPRTTLRAVLFEVVPYAPTLLVYSTWLRGKSAGAVMAFSSSSPGLLVSLSWAVLVALMFVTARSRNGHAALHELLSGTRTVTSSVHRARSSVTALELAMDTASPAQAGVGPYDVQGVLRSDGRGRILLARDAQLDRPVWIRQRAAGAPPVPEARRDLNRPGRLRWLDGGRADDASWDAFEAPAGRPLLDLAEGRQPWNVVRHWLFDLARELQAGLADGTLPARIGLDQVWIGVDGRARWLDFPVDRRVHDAGSSADTERVDATDPDALRTLLAQVASVALEGRVPAPDRLAERAPGVPLPLEARALLVELNRGRVGVDGFAERLTALAASRSGISRGARLVHVASYSALLAFFPFFIGLTFVLLQGDSFVGELEGLAMSMEELRETREELERDGNDATAARAAALEVLIAGRFGHLRSYASTGSQHDPNAGASIGAGARRGMFSQRMERLGVRNDLDVLEREPPTAEESAEAEQVLGEEFLRALQDAEDAGTRKFGSGAALLGGIAAAWVVLAFEWGLLVLAAFVFRGGPLMRLLGFAVVTAEGQPASRFRILVRSLVAFAPIGLSLLAVLPLARLAGRSGEPGLLFACLGVVSLIIMVGLTWCVLAPTRGPHDRIAQTQLVPR